MVGPLNSPMKSPRAVPPSREARYYFRSAAVRGLHGDCEASLRSSCGRTMMLGQSAVARLAWDAASRLICCSALLRRALSPRAQLPAHNASCINHIPVLAVPAVRASFSHRLWRARAK